jgi:anti-sigma factor RsiW
MTAENSPAPVSDDLACKELVELVTEYLEGTLPPSERARFDAHLGLCPGCRTYLEQMRLTIRALGKLSDETIAPRAREELLRAFRDWRRG